MANQTFPNPPRRTADPGLCLPQVHPGVGLCAAPRWEMGDRWEMILSDQGWVMSNHSRLARHSSRPDAWSESVSRRDSPTIQSVSNIASIPIERVATRA